MMREWIWPNRYRGEVVGVINGRRRVMRLSLAALAQIEACYDDTNIAAITQRFSENGMSPKDAENILRAGLAATDDATAQCATALEVEGGADGARALAEKLISRAFENWKEQK